MYNYDSDFYRLRYKEQMEELRKEFQRAQARPRSTKPPSFVNYVQSAWAWMRWRSDRRAPVFRA